MDNIRNEKRKKFIEHDEQVESILLETIKSLSQKKTTAENAQALAAVTETLLHIQKELAGPINISAKFIPEDETGSVDGGKEKRCTKHTHHVFNMNEPTASLN